MSIFQLEACAVLWAILIGELFSSSQGHECWCRTKEHPGEKRLVASFAVSLAAFPRCKLVISAIVYPTLDCRLLDLSNFRNKRNEVRARPRPGCP